MQTNQSTSRASMLDLGSGRNHRLTRWLHRFSVALIAAGALVTAGFAADLAGNGNDHWVGTWATALHEPDLGVPGLSNAGFNNQTVRQIVHTSLGGHQVR